MEMFAKMQYRFISYLITALLAGSFMLSACAPAVTATTLPGPAATTTPTAALEPTATVVPATIAPAATSTPAPAPTAVPTLDGTLQLSMDTGSMATGFQTETVAAVSASDNGPYWELLPEYTRATLQGYPIGNHLMKPQIFIYPVNDLGRVNEGAGRIVASLQTLLQSPQEIPNMPFLPLFNASQVMHTHIQYMDFKNGRGLRYLTQFDQGMMPINNSELIYTYQGLTGDGKYYVAAVLPVNHPSLAADGTVTGNEPPEFTSDFRTYVANVVRALDPQAANTFTPDLTRLDTMMSSMEIK
jgi:hypothetical protein